jgi:hypothetical protein
MQLFIGKCKCEKRGERRGTTKTEACVGCMS